MSRREPCVYCRTQDVDPAWRPFCSERCKLLDLARWVDGAYRIPGEPVSLNEADDDGEAPSKE